MKLQKKIDCYLDSLDTYHKQYEWIPSRYMIRPTPEIIKFKINKLKID